MPRLLIVTTVPATLAGFLVPYADHYRSKGWVVDAAARDAPGDPDVIGSFDHLHDLPISRSLRAVTGNVRAFSSLIGLLGQGYDIVHVHTPIAGFLVRAASRRVPPPARPAIVYTAHGFHFHRDGRMLTNALFLTAERVAGRWTDALVVINHEDEMAARRHRIVPAGRLVYMPGIGIDTAYFSREALPPGSIETARSTLGIGGATPLIVVVGELNANKRTGDVIAALSRMRHRNAHLALIGDGPARGMLEAQTRELGISDRVVFTGPLEDVRPFLATASALVLASKREGLPRSIMEALALDVPVVASAARGNADLLGDDAGLIVPIGDVEALARALDRMLDDPQEAHAMALRGRARMVESYHIDGLLAMHDALYDDLLAAHPE